MQSINHIYIEGGDNEDNGRELYTFEFVKSKNKFHSFKFIHRLNILLCFTKSKFGSYEYSLSSLL